jgi:hypothetical protein
MNANHLLNMIIRIVTRRLMSKGVNAGIDLAARRGKSKEDMTPEEREEARKAREIAKRGRQATRIGRRLF